MSSDQTPVQFSIFLKSSIVKTGNSGTLEHREIIYAFTDRADVVSSHGGK